MDMLEQEIDELRAYPAEEEGFEFKDTAEPLRFSE